MSDWDCLFGLMIATVLILALLVAVLWALYRAGPMSVWT